MCSLVQQNFCISRFSTQAILPTWIVAQVYGKCTVSDHVEQFQIISNARCHTARLPNYYEAYDRLRVLQSINQDPAFLILHKSTKHLEVV